MRRRACLLSRSAQAGAQLLRIDVSLALAYCIAGTPASATASGRIRERRKYAPAYDFRRFPLSGQPGQLPTGWLLPGAELPQCRYAIRAGSTTGRPRPSRRPAERRRQGITPGRDADRVPLPDVRGIEVTTASATYLLAMKLMAMRELIRPITRHECEENGRDRG